MLFVNFYCRKMFEKDFCHFIGIHLMYVECICNACKAVLTFLRYVFMQKQMRGFSIYVFMWSYFPHYNHAQHINFVFYCLRHVNLSRTTYNFQCKVIRLYNASRENEIRT